jgi:hypothetical protein
MKSNWNIVEKALNFKPTRSGHWSQASKDSEETRQKCRILSIGPARKGLSHRKQLAKRIAALEAALPPWLAETTANDRGLKYS